MSSVAVVLTINSSAI